MGSRQIKSSSELLFLPLRKNINIGTFCLWLILFIPFLFTVAEPRYFSPWLKLQFTLNAFFLIALSADTLSSEIEPPILKQIFVRPVSYFYYVLNRFLGLSLVGFILTSIPLYLLIWEGIKGAIWKHYLTITYVNLLGVMIWIAFSLTMDLLFNKQHSITIVTAFLIFVMLLRKLGKRENLPRLERIMELVWTYIPVKISSIFKQFLSESAEIEISLIYAALVFICLCLILSGKILGRRMHS